MNLVIEIGRLTKDPEVRHNADKCVANYTLAVDRKFKQEGQPDADFIRCVAWNKNAEFAEKYLKKGMKILVRGRIQTGSYTDKDGKTIYTTDVIVEEHEFVESKKSSEEKPEASAEGFIPIDVNDEELPFL